MYISITSFIARARAYVMATKDKQFTFNVTLIVCDNLHIVSSSARDHYARGIK